MSLHLDNLEIVYKRYYELSLQIGELIDRDLLEELPPYIRHKTQIFKEAGVLVEKIKKTNEDASKLEGLCKKIQEQEKQNIKRLQEIKAGVKEELQTTTKTKRLISAYSASEFQKGSILDFSE